MKKAWIVIGIVTFIGIGVGLVWMIVNKAAVPTTNQQAVTDESATSAETTAPADQTNVAEANVIMQNSSFEPQTLTIKKGTKVTWTNKDTVRHNVVADSASNAAGLPTTNELIGNGQTYTYTFNAVGTITYHCTPHPFMTGTVEVIE